MNDVGRSNRERVVVAMSGGVDSSVAALLLARAGYDVVGVTMRLFDPPAAYDPAPAVPADPMRRERDPANRPKPGRAPRSCCSTEDADDARAVCRRIGVRHHFLSFQDGFRRYVIDPFVREYERGRTPYPCAACNTWMKFHLLMQRADLLDARYLATGHYARVLRDGGRWRLLRGLDSAKDQSYALCSLTQQRMERLLLPLGEHTKEEARAIAREAGLPVAEKRASQDICFVPDGDYRSFVEPRLSRRTPGVIVDTDGRQLRRHEGIHLFTVGQRHGLPLPGGTGTPLYVTAIDPDSGTVTVGPAERLMHRTLCASAVNWLAGAPPDAPLRVDARIRYRAAPATATVTATHDGALVEFDEPQRAPTPGQTVVFYSADEVIGGGTIEPAAAPESPPTSPISRSARA